MTALVVILAIAIGTYAMRAVPFALASSLQVSVKVEPALRLIGPAAVAALVATLIFSQSGAFALRPSPELVAIVAGYVAVRKTGNVVNAFVVGMPVLWVLTPVLS